MVGLVALPEGAELLYVTIGSLGLKTFWALTMLQTNNAAKMYRFLNISIWVKDYEKSGGDWLDGILRGYETG